MPTGRRLPYGMIASDNTSRADERRQEGHVHARPLEWSDSDHACGDSFVVDLSLRFGPSRRSATDRPTSPGRSLTNCSRRRQMCEVWQASPRAREVVRKCTAIDRPGPDRGFARGFAADSRTAAIYHRRQ